MSIFSSLFGNPLTANPNGPKNSEGVPMKLGTGSGTAGDMYPIPNNRVWYCGRKMLQCRCKKCDGVCGPTNGCPCNSCKAYTLGKLPTNSEGFPIFLGGGSGTTGDLKPVLPFEVYYCGKKKNECRCGSCDGVCGPTNGCPCNSCKAYYLQQKAAKSNSNNVQQSSKYPSPSISIKSPPLSTSPKHPSPSTTSTKSSPSPSTSTKSSPPITPWISKETELEQLMKSLDLNHLMPILQVNALDISTLKVLTEDELKEIVPVLGERKKLIIALKENEQKNSPMVKPDPENHAVEKDVCKICWEKSVEMAFAECGHLACCQTCGVDLKACPICRKTSKQIKIFFT